MAEKEEAVYQVNHPSSGGMFICGTARPAAAPAAPARAPAPV